MRFDFFLSSFRGSAVALDWFAAKLLRNIRTCESGDLPSGLSRLFRNKILHRSAPDPTSLRRLGLAIRYTVPGVTIDTTAFFPGYRTVAVSVATARACEIAPRRNSCHSATTRLNRP